MEKTSFYPLAIHLRLSLCLRVMRDNVCRPGSDTEEHIHDRQTFENSAKIFCFVLMITVKNWLSLYRIMSPVCVRVEKLPSTIQNAPQGILVSRASRGLWQGVGPLTSHLGAGVTQGPCRLPHIPCVMNSDDWPLERTSSRERGSRLSHFLKKKILTFTEITGVLTTKTWI